MVVDRQLKLDILDILRRKKFQGVKEIAVAKGISVEETKAALVELVNEKQVFFFAQ
jgi:NCAIR mutase (PurE)-related protein